LGNDVDNCEQGEEATTGVEHSSKESANVNVDIEECSQCVNLKKECDKFQQEATKLCLKVVDDDILVTIGLLLFKVDLDIIICWFWNFVVLFTFGTHF